MRRTFRNLNPLYCSILALAATFLAVTAIAQFSEPGHASSTFDPAIATASR